MNDYTYFQDIIRKDLLYQYISIFSLNLTFSKPYFFQILTCFQDEIHSQNLDRTTIKTLNSY